MTARPIRAALALALLAAAASLAAPARAETFETSAGPVEVSPVGPVFENPWAVAFLPDFAQTGALLVTERPGRLVLVARDGARAIEGLPEIYARGQGGLLDVALSPDFAQTGLLHLTYSAPAEGGGADTHVARARLDREAGRLEDLEVVLAMQTHETGGRHFGSRLAHAPDGTLFVTMGERGNRPSAQDPDVANGKVHRIFPDGRIPQDNPFAQGGGLASVWSLGHRNPQGAAVDPETGTLWVVEHGARGGDEVNRPVPGGNFGWPEVSYGTHYSGREFPRGATAPGIEPPAHYWDPSIAPSGLAVYRGALFPEWDGDLLVGALKFQKIVRLDVEGGEIAGSEDLVPDAYGRIRDVRVGPDGAIWFLTDAAEGRLLRMAPAD
ncbi:PQQ-dependent sugar dehydrogenase [Albimonas sp. CAU 1670]|uniref:PQQ-dependent sugar dehydrogenase n=1 Tax=Albimonas sp. CAU 1670 TaxID=3032599 RepID=UPI0023D9C136|nr:PQQ-dependent sugar dehydrogenase [Albimonas sp. CAU 1670]MDF2234375.1 PQQ-dependent sugar dehydrogenase [Albimonas sp. CAU 1670]